MMDWKTVELGEVCTLQRGMDLPKRLRTDGQFPLVTSSGIDGTHHIGPVKGPGVITGRYGTIGKVFYVESDFWPLNTTLYVRDFHGNDARFVHYLLQTVDFQSHSGKSGVPGVNRNDVHQEWVCVPADRSEQERISQALLDTDTLIDSLEQLLTKKRQIKQGAMQELLTGKRRLPGFSGTWTESTLIDLAERKKEQFDDGDWIESEHIRSEGIRLIQTGNIGVGTYLEKSDKKYIDDHSFSLLKCKELKVGDLLICRLADPAGRACVLPNIGEERVVTSVDVTIFRPPADLASRDFLVQVFSRPEWFRSVSDLSGGTTHKRISRGALGRMRIVLPPVNEQIAIAQVLSEMDDDIAAIEGRLTKARALKQAMAQALLTGRIRLVEPTT